MTEAATAEKTNQAGRATRALAHPLRVLHVCFAPVFGGTETLCLQLVKHSDLSLWSPEVVFLSEEPGPLLGEFEASGVRVHVCPMVRHEALGFVRRFARLCRERSAYAVHCHCFGVQFFVALGARLGGAQKVLTALQNPAPRAFGVRLKTALLAQLARPLVSWQVACSQHVADSVVRSYRVPARRLRTLWNWCDVEGIARRAEAARAARSTVGPVIGMVSRLDPIKDHDTLLRAFALFRQRHPGARLCLVGDGSLRARLEQTAADLGVREAVEFLGGRTDIPEQLAQFDIFAFSTTDQEGFGIVLAEAMAAGVPIVASDTGPCPEVLAGGAAGLLARAGDPQAMAEALDRLWSDRQLRERLASAAGRLARERYSVERARDSLSDLMLGL